MSDSMRQDCTQEEDIAESIDFGDDTTNGDFEVVEDTTNDLPNTKPQANPTICDYEWTDYVLADLHDNEMFNGNPTVDSLRRLVNKFVGPIINNETAICNHSSETYVTAIVRIIVNTNLGSVCYTGAADASKNNIKSDPYDKFLVSIAEVRAEGRCLRKILNLRKTVAAEEMIDNTVVTETNNDDITNNQLNFIDIMSRDNERGLNINVELLIKETIGHSDITKLTHTDGLTITNVLSKYQQDKASISDKLIGYKQNWKVS